MKKEKYLLMRDRRDPLNPVYWVLIGQSLAEKVYGIKMTKKTWFAFYPDGKSQHIVLKKEWDKIANIISKKLLENEFFKKLQKKCQLKSKNIKKFLKKIKKKNISQSNYKELINLAKEIKRIWLNFEIVNMPAWFIAGDKLKEKINRLSRLPQDDFLFLTTPMEKTEVNKLEYELLKYTKSIKEKRGNLEKVAEKLSEKYGWIPCGYRGIECWDEDCFIKKLNKNIKNYSKKIDKKIELIKQLDEKNLNKRNKLIKEYKLSKRQLELIDRINTLTLWTDKRKKLEFQLHYYYAQVLLELCKRYNFPYKNIRYLFTEEMSEIEKNKDKLIQTTNKRMNTIFMFTARNGKIIIIPEKKKKEILQKIDKQIKQTKTIMGTVASKGTRNTYKGLVKILFSPKDSNKIKVGDFLIATMTTPDYILSMKKARGFITDEGGVTCHAAIVAREMNKPCVIGTKIATKVLKDGDLVEVDANRGIVKKIK